MRFSYALTVVGAIPTPVNNMKHEKFIRYSGLFFAFFLFLLPFDIYADTFVVPSDTSSVDITVTGGSAYEFVLSGDLSDDSELRLRINSDTGSNYCWSAITSASHANVCSNDFVRLTRDGGDTDRLSFGSNFLISSGLSAITGSFSGYRFSASSLAVSGNSDGSFAYVGSSKTVSSVSIYPSSGNIKAGTIVSWSPVVVSSSGSSTSTPLEVDFSGFYIFFAFVMFYLTSGFFIFYFKRQ